MPDFPAIIARLFAPILLSPNVHSIDARTAYRSTNREIEMDVLNTFLVFNITASIAVLLGFFMMRDSVAATVTGLKARAASFNVAGAAGAATSMVVLASVATLFR
jgi:hypothetical protein